MFDDEDDFIDDGADPVDSGATDFSSQSRRAPGKPDFSAFGEKVTAPPESNPLSATARKSGGKPAGKGLDFSAYGERITVPTNPPLPRARPDLGTPADEGYEPSFMKTEAPTEREGAPFRTGGSVLDRALGTESGMLTGDEANKSHKDRVTGAETGLATARADRESAQARLDAVKNADPEEAVSADRRNVRRALTQAQRRERQAAEGLDTALRAPPPTQGTARNLAETAISTAAGMAADTMTGARGVAEAIPDPLDWLDPATAKKMRTRNRQIDDNFRKSTEGLGRPDPTQTEDFSSQLTAGGVSMAGFMAGGVATRMLGMGAGTGAGVLGAFQMGGQQLHEAEDAIKVLDHRITTGKAQGQDTTADQAKLDLLLKTKYVALFAGMGLGATEAIPIERFFNRLNEVSHGRVGQILASSTTQGMEEMLQEIGQTVGSNVVAKLLYEEGRDIFKGVNDSAGVALVLGGLMGAGAGMIATRRGNRAAETGVPMPEPAPVTGLDTPPPPPPPGASPIEQVLSGAPAQPTKQWPPTDAEINEMGPDDYFPPGGRDGDFAAGDTTVPDTQSTSAATAIERRTLRKQGFSDEMIDGMGRAEIDDELGQAADQGVELETEEPAGDSHPPKNTDPIVPTPDQAMAGLSEMFGGTPPQDQQTDEPKSPIGIGTKAMQTYRDQVREQQGEKPDFSEHGTPAEGAGTKTDPVKVNDAQDLERVDQQVAADPTPGQKGAENFKMGHIRWPGLRREISIETAKGGTRTDKNGKWTVPNYPVRYGRIKGTKGADGQHIDAFVGDDITVPHGFILDQYDPKTGAFDEHKTFFGIADPAEVARIYDSVFTDSSGPSRRGSISQVPLKVMNAWMLGGRKKKAFGKDKPKQPTSTESVDPDVIAKAREDFAQFGVGTKNIELRLQAIEQNLGPAARTAYQTEYDRLVAEAVAERQQAQSGQGDRGSPADAQASVTAALQAAGIPPASVDQADVAAAAQIVAETGAEPADAFQEVMAQQIEEPTDAADSANEIPASLETGESSGQPTEGELVPGSGETVEPETPESGGADQSGALDFSDQADQASEPDQAAAEAETGTDAAVAEKPTKTAFVETAIDKKPRIEDAGEKIGGARKDAWGGRGMTMDDLASMSGAEKAAKVNKQAVWPRPDYAALVEGGMDAKTAFLIKRIYDNVPTTYNAREFTAEDYVRAVLALREAVQAVKTSEEAHAVSGNLERETSRPLRHAKGGNRFYAAGYLSYKDDRLAEKAIKEGFPNLEPWQRMFKASEATAWWDEPPFKKGDTIWQAVRKKNGEILGNYATREEAEERAKKAYAERGKDDDKVKDEPSRPHLDNVARVGPDVRQGADKDSPDFISDLGFRGVEFGNWVAGDERQKTINLAYDALNDLARIIKVPAKALSLNGTLGVAFGARGKGGKFSAHYEAHRLVINMTKVSGAGSLAHEWAHALDHYLGEVDSPNGYGGAPKSISRWRDTSVDESTFKNRKLANLSPRLNRAANAVMQALHFKTESDAQWKSRTEETAARRSGGLESWEKEAERVKDLIRAKGSSRGLQARLRKATEQIEVWTRHNAHIARTENDRKQVPTDYYQEAKKISGSGDYWYRPNELFARAFEAYIFDKLTDENQQSQYLVQGVESDRYASNEYKGNAYPSGEERGLINAAFDEFVKALEAAPGKHGDGAKLIGASKEDWKTPSLQEQWQEPTVTDITPVKPITSAEKKEQTEDEMKALDQETSDLADGTVSVNRTAVLAAKFASHLRDGGEFGNILAARKMAKESGFDGDAKAVEEAMELALVQVGREIAADRSDPKANFTALVDLYERQPKLGTRTSTSMRDQAFSTPLPLAYIASRLVNVIPEVTVYEPSAGNGALLIETQPNGEKWRQNVRANEINPERRANLESQGFEVTAVDASETVPSTKRYDIILANPPFGAVRQESQSKVFDLTAIQNGYKTKEIDHAIALRALAVMKDNGRAVLILGGLNKLTATREARSDGYNGKAKREFYKTLYDLYNVTDHFTVAGELYERQGAGWPVDVIVIDGRGKSSRSLPAVDVPRVLNSWDQLGGLLDGIPGRGASAADQPAQRNPEGRPGGRDAGVRSGGGDERVSALGPEPGQSDDVLPGPVQRPGDDAAGGAGQAQAGVDRGDTRGTAAEPDAERRPSGLDDDFDAAFDSALDDTFGPQAGPKSSEAPRAPRTRSTGAVAKSAVSNAAQSADQAMAGLVQLFGGGKTVGEGLNFDAATYAKAKPLFTQAAVKFAAFKDDVGELVRRMVDELQKLYGLTRDGLAKIKPYLKEFIREVTAGTIQIGESTTPKPATTKSVPAKQEAETATQVVYAPKSAVPGLGTLVPVNMQGSINDALADLEKRVGNLDRYVEKELGYDQGGLDQYFAAEQIDALALAIDNLDRGKGFIIGDQTGIGKGRVNAAIIRWAIKKGRVPVFVTEKPNLYKDMYRDLGDIGIADGFLDGAPRILATNADENIPLDDDGQINLKTGSSGDHARLLQSLSAENIGEGYDMVFTTYSQMQTVAGKDTARRDFLKRLAPNAVLIFDESHNAGGQGKAKGKSKTGQVNRSGFARDLVKTANGVFYSSATYAKRPDVMDLYAATDMVMAVEKIDDLAEAIARGGVPMQQVVASMLAKAGQYIRRERSFAGVTYDTPVIDVDKEQYDGISGALADIQAFSLHVAQAAEKLDEDIKAQAQAMGHDNATGVPGADSVLFTSIMHNIINQMLLAMKAGPVAQMAIAALKRGEKPVITVANTMESFLSDYAETIGIKPGEVMDVDFSKVLLKYLDRTRTLIIKKPFTSAKDNPVERRYLSDEELGPIAVRIYNEAKRTIEGLMLADLPVSPIDRIKQDLANAGYTVGEITGRGTIMDYSGDEPVLRNRPGKETSIRGRIKTIGDFNSGATDAVILNQAGATGLSLHASEKFADKRQRHMLIAQAEANIDTHMQILGRVHRTGQVIVPKYSQLVADIPAEKRPAAVLAKKMASLNANTTASRGGALTAKDVPDFINEYGDMVAATLIADDMALNVRLGSPIKIKDSGALETDDAMRRLTGRIPLLPLKEQEALYEHLESEYAALLEQMTAAGENALEAQTIDLKAKTIEGTEVVPAKSGSKSPFAAPVYIERVSAVRQGKPFSAVELMSKLSEALGGGVDFAHTPKGEESATAANMLNDIADPYGTWGEIAAKKESDQRSDAVEEFDTYLRSVVDEIENPDKATKERTKLNAVKDRFTAIHEMLKIGSRITLKTNSGNLTGIVLKTERTGDAKNPLALSTWKATFALADATRQVTLPFSRLFMSGKSSEDDRASIEIQTIGWYESVEQTIEKFAALQNASREERFIATGNLLAAYDWLARKGRIVNYTDDHGSIRQGILTAKEFDLVKHYEQKARPIHSPADVLNWMRNNKGETLWSEDNVVRLDLLYSNDLYITVEGAKRAGGKYYLDQELTRLTRDFTKRGGTMRAEATNSDNAKIERIITRLQTLGATFVDRSSAKPPPPIAPEDIRASMAPVPKGWEVVEGSPAWRLSDDEIAEVTGIVRRVANIDPEFAESITIPAGSPGAVAWGRTTEGQAQGVYSPTTDTITVALSYAGRRTAYHEAFHRLQHKFLNPREKAVLASETENLRDILRKDIARSSDADRMDAHEVEADAFAVYAVNRDNGKATPGLVNPMLKRAWARLYLMLSRLRNALRGLGYQTADDIFERAYSGEIAGRAANPAAATGAPQFMAARRRPAAAGDVIRPPETVRDAWDQPDKTIRQRLSEAFDAMVLGPAREIWDPVIDTLRFQKAAAAIDGTTVPESLDMYLAATLYAGRVGEQMKDAQKKLWLPVFDAMRDKKVGRSELHDYLYARHAPERNAAIREIDPSNEAGSGMTDAEAAAIMGSVVGREADFQSIAELIDGIVEHNRALMVRAGLESEATVEAWRDKYTYYVPMKGFEAGEDDETFGTPSSGQGFDTRRPESRRALGRFDKADDILLNLFDQTQRTIVRAEKNKVAKTVLRFMREHLSPFWKIGLRETRRRINPLTGLVESYTTTISTEGKNVFAAKVGGQTYYIQILHEGLLTGLKNLGANRMHPFFRLAGRLTREYSRFQTAKNPEFVFSNLAKDLQDAGFTLSGEQRERLLTRYVANLAKGKALYGAILGITETRESSPMRRWFEEWREAGGKISHYGLKDLDEIRKEMLRELNQRTESKGKSALLALPRLVNPINGKFVKFIEALSDITESTTRLAVYISAREVGLSKAQAAQLSRNATVDFNKGGPTGHALNALYAFSKANILGNVRLLRTLRKSKIARRAAMGIAVAGMLMTYWNMAMSPEDEEKKRSYEKRKYWERERNILIYWPGMKPEDHAAKIPLGYGLNVFWMMGEQVAMRMLGKVSTVEAMGNVLGTTVSAFNPLGSAGSFFDWKTWAKAIVPTVIRPIPELALNRNWADRTIHPDQMPWTEGKPHSDQHKAFTHPAAIAMTAALNRLTGGNKYEPGWLDFYPDDVQYAYDFAVGGFGRFLKNTHETIANYVDGVDTPVERIPFVRRFVVSDNSPAIASDAYYTKRRDEQTKARQLRNAVKSRSEGTDDGTADAVIERLARETGAKPSRNNRGISVPAEGVFRNSDKEIKELRGQEDRIRKDQSIKPADRKVQIDGLRRQMREIMAQARANTAAATAP